MSQRNNFKYQEERELAKQNPQDGDLQYRVGTYYLNGHFSIDNDAQAAQAWALKYFEKAAAVNEPESMYALGLHYYNNIHIAGNKQKMIEWMFRYLSHEKANVYVKCNAFTYISKYRHDCPYENAICELNNYGVTGSKVAAFNGLLAAADDERAMFMLGTLYEQGDIVSQNLTRAFDWYFKSARCNKTREGGSKAAFEAMQRLVKTHPVYAPAWRNKLDICFEYGYVAPKDPIAAMTSQTPEELYRFAISRGELAIATRALSILQERNAKNPEDPEVHYYLGLCYETGLGTPSMPANAKSHFTRAAGPIDIYIFSRQKDRAVTRTMNLARFKLTAYLNPEDSDELRLFSSLLIRVARDADLPELITTAIKQLQDLCQKYPDNAFIQNDYAICLINGIGLPKDMDGAINYFTKAAMQGARTSMINLRHLYYENHQHELAAKWAVEAAKVKHPNAVKLLEENISTHPIYRRALAQCYAEGYGMEKPDIERAIQLLTDKNAVIDDIDMVQAAEIYLHKCPRNDKNMFAARMKLIDAVRLKTKNQEGSLRAFEIINQLVKENPGHEKLLNDLAYCYDYGLGVDQNEKKAIELYEQCIQLHNAVSMGNLAIHYANGTGGIIRNRKKALELTFMAIKFVSPCDDLNRSQWFSNIQIYSKTVPAQYELGMCHLNGWGTPVDIKTAKDCLLDAAKNHQDERAYHALGTLYESGQEMESDSNPPYWWHYQAATASVDRADGKKAGFLALERLYHANPDHNDMREKLIECYEKGHGTSVNLAKAADLYRAAADTLYLDIDRKALNQRAMLAQVPQLRTAYQRLSTCVYHHLKSQRGLLLSQGSSPASFDVLRLNWLITTAQSLKDSQSIESVMRNPDLAQQLERDGSPEARHLLTHLQREKQLSAFAGFIQQAFAELLKEIIRTPWQVSNGFVWTRGIPSGVKEIKEVLEQAYTDSPDTILERCRKIDRIAASKSLEKGSGRHDLTIQFYEKIKLCFGKFDFMAEQQPVMVAIPAPPTPIIEAIQPEPASALLPPPAAVPTSSTAYLLNQPPAPVRTDMYLIPIQQPSAPASAAATKRPAIKQKALNTPHWTKASAPVEAPANESSFLSTIGGFFKSVGSFFSSPSAPNHQPHLQGGQEMNLIAQAQPVLAPSVPVPKPAARPPHYSHVVQRSGRGIQRMPGALDTPVNTQDNGNASRSDNVLRDDVDESRNEPLEKPASTRRIQLPA